MKTRTLLLMCILPIILCTFAQAKIIYVDDDSPADFNNIQAAIDDANNGDIILVADGTYTGDGNRDIDFKGTAITLKSQNGAEKCIIDCNGSDKDLHRGFYFQSGEGNDSVLDGFTIMHGCAYNGGGIRCENSSPTIKNCIIHDNIASIYLIRFPDYVATDGGGICLSEAENVKIINCHFFNNKAEGNGGAICSWASNGLLFNCEINNNRAFVGGAISLSDENMSIVNCIISGNIANSNYYGGGGIFCSSYSFGGIPIINNCTIIGNLTHGIGGGICVTASDIVIRNSVIRSNKGLEGPEIGFVFSTLRPASISIGYSDVKGGESQIFFDSYCRCMLDWQKSNKEIDPFFANPGYWDPNSTSGDANDDYWVEGDYHLKSQARRFDPNSQSWVQDDITSPCIDAGDPNSPIGLEPFPNGGYINIGAYGGTSEASKSYFGEPVCETIVAGDINGDCKVDQTDLDILMLHWLEEY